MKLLNSGDCSNILYGDIYDHMIKKMILIIIITKRMIFHDDFDNKDSHDKGDKHNFMICNRNDGDDNYKDNECFDD